MDHTWRMERLVQSLALLWLRESILSGKCFKIRTWIEKEETRRAIMIERNGAERSEYLSS